MLEGVTSYVLQVILGLIALAALWKDWKEYPKRSKRWGRTIQVSLAIAAVVVIALSLAETHNSRVSAYKQRDALTTQIGQLRDDAKIANDGFRASFSGLYDKFSQLQSQVNNTDLLKQNATLIRQIDETKKELLATEAKLTPQKATLIATFQTLDAKSIPITELDIPRGETVSVPILIYNSSDTAALTGIVNIEICRDCTFASEPVGFTKVAGSSEQQRTLDFQHVYARSAMQLLTVVIKPPTDSNRIQVGVRATCQNCPSPEYQSLWVNLK
jgi:hypothetical protein